MFIPLMIALSQPVNLTQSEPCKLSVINYQETNNCPLLTGTFASEEWIINLSYWEPGAYVLRGINRFNGKKIKTRPLAKIAGTGSPARPTKIFFLVGWASSPFQNLIKTTFARGLLSEILAGKEFDKKK